MKRRTLILAVLLLTCLAYGESGTVVILHTNDIHDHVRPASDGAGGLAYVSGYIRSVREERKDVLVLDAGDVMEKGDMVAFETHSRITYEALGKIGYDAGAVGNHDLKSGGLKLLRECEALAHLPLLCINYAKEDGTLYFPPSKVVAVGNVKVGIIGVTVPKKDGPSLDFNASVKAVAEEAKRLKPETHLLVALCHMDSQECGDMSAAVPDIQVFVGGHSHEVLTKPITVPKTGALIVQAGDYSRYVGRLELKLDLESRKVTRANGSLIEMRNGKVPCDDAMPAWVRQREQEICPDAERIVAQCGRGLRADEVARLAAAAFRQRAGADAAFCHTRQIIRAGLPKGDIDVNALFLTGGQRGNDLVATSMTGAQIEAYLKGLMALGKGKTEWAGFRGDITYSKDDTAWIAHTDLDPNRAYRVVIPQLEWDTRLKKVSEKGAAEPSKCDFSYIDALRTYVETVSKEKTALDVQVDRLTAATALDSANTAVKKAS